MELLDDERFEFYLLIDRKSKTPTEDFIPELKYSKVNVLDRIDINWGSYSQINATLLLMKSAVRDKCDFIHYLQGSDLPLKTPNQIDGFFSDDRIYLEINDTPSDFASYKVLCKHYFTKFRHYRTNRVLKIVDHAIAHIFKPFVKMMKKHGTLYQGSALFSIPLDFAEYVLSLEKAIQRQYKNTLAADEVFINSIYMNSPYRTKLKNNGGARLIDWKNHEGNSPKTFTVEDKEELLSAIHNPNIMFARKFSEERDLNIVKYIQSVLKE